MGDQTLEYKPKILILPTSADVEDFVSKELVLQIQQKPNSVLTLPTGGTPLGVYSRLVEFYKEKKVDFAQVTVFNLDEYWPIKKSHPSSYDYYMNQNLYKFVNIPVEGRNIPSGEAKNFKEEASRYEKLLRKTVIDVGIITLGPNKTCHIGFNERGSTIDSRVRYVLLDEQTKKANMRFFDKSEDVPIGAITQGVADILSAKRIIFVATGKHKAWGVRRTLNGEISSEAPASFLRCHPNVVVVLDREAASLIS